jgi:hypothetical protein
MAIVSFWLGLADKNDRKGEIEKESEYMLLNSHL